MKAKVTVGYRDKNMFNKTGFISPVLEQTFMFNPILNIINKRISPIDEIAINSLPYRIEGYKDWPFLT